jgi:hypothetical protein
MKVSNVADNAATPATMITARPKRPPLPSGSDSSPMRAITPSSLTRMVKLEVAAQRLPGDGRS